VAIEQVAAGRSVVSRDPETGRTTVRPVSRTFRRTSQQMVTAELADARTGQVVETITATPEHPFYVQGQGFQPLGSLGIGTSIVTSAGPPLVVRSVDWQEHPQGVAVYNFEVESDHTYFVGGTDGRRPQEGILPSPALTTGPEHQPLARLLGWHEDITSKYALSNCDNRGALRSAEGSTACRRKWQRYRRMGN
jgi:hypothetical protein